MSTLVQSIPTWINHYWAGESAASSSSASSLNLTEPLELVPAPSAEILSDKSRPTDCVISLYRRLMERTHCQEGPKPKEWSQSQFAWVATWNSWNLLSNEAMAWRGIVVEEKHFLEERQLSAPGWHLLHDFHAQVKGPRDLPAWQAYHLKGEGEELHSLSGDSQPPCLGHVVSWKRLQAVLEKGQGLAASADVGELLVYLDNSTRTYRWGKLQERVLNYKPSVPYDYRVIVDCRDGLSATSVVPLSMVLGVYRDWPELKVHSPAATSSPIFERHGRGSDYIEVSKASNFQQQLCRLPYDFTFATSSSLEWRVLQLASSVFDKDLAKLSSSDWNDQWNLRFAHLGLAIPGPVYGQFPDILPLGKALFFDYYRLQEYCNRNGGMEAFVYNQKDVQAPAVDMQLPFEVLLHTDFSKRSAQKFAKNEWVAVIDPDQQLYRYARVVDTPKAGTQELSVLRRDRTAGPYLMKVPSSQLGKIKGIDLPVVRRIENGGELKLN